MRTAVWILELTGFLAHRYESQPLFSIQNDLSMPDRLSENHQRQRLGRSWQWSQRSAEIVAKSGAGLVVAGTRSRSVWRSAGQAPKSEHCWRGPTVNDIAARILSGVISERGAHMSNVRFAIKTVITSLARSVGLEIRHTFQNPPLTSAAIYAPWLTPSEVTCIFDVGANVGQSAHAFAKEFDRSIVHSFEPFPAAYARLEKLARSSGGRIKAHRLACGSSIGEMDVAIDPESTSVLNQLRPAISGNQKSRVQISTIDAICGHHGIERIDILKTDTEGYDAEVLVGAHRMLSERRVRCIICEVGFLGDKQHTDFTTVFLFLQQLGFEIAGLYEISYTRNLRTEFTNALFARKDEKLSDAYANGQPSTAQEP
jgi:FkbM family methyltransferase